jgi:hypothetical protein
MTRLTLHVLAAVLLAGTPSAVLGAHVVYTSLPLPVPDNRPADQLAADAAKTSFLAALSAHGTETLDGFTAPPLGFTPTQALSFGATGITAVARFSGAFTIPALPTPVSSPNMLVLQPPTGGNPPYANDMAFSVPITAFGSYFVQAGDVLANTLTLRLENTLLGTSKDIVMGTVGPAANFNSVFFYGITDTDPFNKVTLLPSNGADGILLDNITAGTLVPEPSTMVLLAAAAVSAYPLLRSRRRRR